jgi:hypothetical protein
LFDEARCLSMMSAGWAICLSTNGDTNDLCIAEGIGCPTLRITRLVHVSGRRKAGCMRLLGSALEYTVFRMSWIARTT